MNTPENIRTSHHSLANALLLCVAAVWGSSYGVAKYNLSFMPVLWFLALRFCLTFALLAPALARAWSRSPAQLHETMRIGLPLGALLLCVFVLETYGVAHTQAANAALLISLCVVFTPFAEWGLLQRRPMLSVWLFSALSLLGVLLIVGKVSLFQRGGDVLMILAAVARALMVTLTQKLTQQSVRAQTVNMWHLTAVQSGVVGVGCLLLAIMRRQAEFPIGPTDATFWGNTVYLVVCCTLFAFFVQNYAAKQVGATRTALLMGNEPLFGVVFAALYLGEHLSLNAYLGGLLIVTVSLWVSVQRTQP